MLQGTLFPPQVAWQPPRLADLPQDWSVFPRIAFDVETRDEQLVQLGPGVRRGAYIVGFCLGFEDSLGQRRGYYLPIRHLGGDNCEEGPEAVTRYVAENAARYEGELVGAKLDYDLDFGAETGVHWPRVKAVKDVQVIEPLLDELQFSYSLDNILKRHGLPLKDESALRQAVIDFGLLKKGGSQNIKAHLWKLPARYVGAYGERDVVAPLELMAKQEAEVARLGLERVWGMEQRVTPILVKMRRRGIRVDHDQVDRMEAWSIREETAAWAELKRLTGIQIKLGDGFKAEALSVALAAVDILPGRTAQNKPSISAPWLETLDHPVAPLIRRARKMSTLRTTFVASVRDHSIRGRIHTTFNQIVRQKDEATGSETVRETEGAAYGRLSSVDPNLQQQPARDEEIGPEWRKVYVADEGELLVAPDYSQQEPRLAVHAAVASGPERIGERAHRSALEAAERYNRDRSTDAHTMFCQMVHSDFSEWPKDGPLRVGQKQTRKMYKNIYLGICYGEGEPKMCRELGLPTMIIEDERSGRRREVAGPEGAAILRLIDQQVPYVKATAYSVQRVAKSRGYITTIGGRHLHFPKDPYGNYENLHKAFNRFIQGSAADQTKQAMIALDEAGIPLQLQIHDEFVFSTADRRVMRQAAEIMENVVPLHVPSKVDLEAGPNWGDVHELEPG